MIKNIQNTLKRFSLVNRRDQVHAMVRKMVMMLASGIHLTECLRLIIKGMKARNQQEFRSVIRDVLKLVMGGLSLNDALRKHPQWFPDMMVAIVKVGEESGKLLHVLQEHLSYLYTQAQYRKKFKSALTYPIVVVIIAILTVIFLSLYLLPTFSNMYAEMGMELPAFTRGIMWFSRSFGTILLVIFLILVVITLILKQASSITRLQTFFSRTIQKLPVIGHTLKQVITVYYFQILITLLESGITLLRSLEICHSIARSGYTKGFFGFIIRHFKEGRSFAELVEQSDLLEPEFNHLIMISENSGSLPEAFRQIKESINDEIEGKLDNISAILEPIIIVTLGIIVGIILIGMYLPIFELSSSSGL